MEASIGQVARATGTTTRTLRHYQAIGLVRPSRTAPGGVRWYDEDTLVRLQRVLLLRDLGLPLTRIAEIVDARSDESTALRQHLAWLDVEADRLSRQAAAVRRTLTAREEGTVMDVGEMFDGFDHTTYKDEVVERWGADAYAASDAWWRTLGEQGQTAWRRESAALAQAWVALAATGADPSGSAAQELAARHVIWASQIPGTPGSADEPDLDYVTGLGELYVADPRFSRTYGGQAGAELVRDALTAWAVAR